MRFDVYGRFAAQSVQSVTAALPLARRGTDS